jgi:hypothetical protein
MFTLTSGRASDGRASFDAVRDCMGGHDGSCFLDDWERRMSDLTLAITGLSAWVVFVWVMLHGIFGGAI